MPTERMTLLERTHLLLMTRPRGVTMHDVARNSGVSFHFVHSLSIRETKEPGVNRVQKVYEYLAGRKLEY